MKRTVLILILILAIGLHPGCPGLPLLPPPPPLPLPPLPHPRRFVPPLRADSHTERCRGKPRKHPNGQESAVLKARLARCLPDRCLVATGPLAVHTGTTCLIRVD